MIDLRWINRIITISLLMILLAGAPLLWHFSGVLSEMAMSPLAHAGQSR